MDVVPFKKGGAVADPRSLKAGLKKYQQEAPPAFDGAILLRLLKDGDWVFGPNNEEVDEKSVWAVNPYSVQHGLSSWTDHGEGKKNDLVGEVMVPFTEPAPLADAQRDTGWPWRRQVSMDLVCVKGADKGQAVLYKTNSVGGLRAMEDLIKALLVQLDKDEDKCVPMLRLESDHYPHKKWGRTYVPILSIIGWATMDDTEAPETEAEAEEEEPKPKRTRKARKAKAPEPEPEPEEDEDEEFDPENEADPEEYEEAEPAPRQRKRRG